MLVKGFLTVHTKYVPPFIPDGRYKTGMNSISDHENSLRLNTCTVFLIYICRRIEHVMITMTFNPPREGLRSGENVVWVRKRGTNFWVIFFGMMLGIGGTVCTINSLVFAGLLLAVPLLILMVTGFCFVLRAFFMERGTKYYLTNERLLETRKGLIAREISLEKFHGKPLSQFLEKKAIGTVNEQPIYVISIYDPESGETLMEFKDLDATSAEALERIGQTAECGYCGFKNPANSLKCGNCGAPI
jgi:hypothetical protein